jgi:hypothetical protein
MDRYTYGLGSPRRRSATRERQDSQLVMGKISISLRLYCCTLPRGTTRSRTFYYVQDCLAGGGGTPRAPIIRSLIGRRVHNGMRDAGTARAGWTLGREGQAVPSLLGSSDRSRGEEEREAWAADGQLMSTRGGEWVAGRGEQQSAAAA